MNQVSNYALPLFTLIAALYSSVGHGGATGYLALMSFFDMPPQVMSTTALVLNCLTAGISCFVYTRAGYLSAKLTLPFVLTSVPFALLGALIKLSEKQYSWLLATALSITAALLIFRKKKPTEEERFVCSPPFFKAACVGALLGFVSGAIGIGGGVFLSPIIILMRWADTKTTSATAAVFIIANSVSGLVGRLMAGTLEFGNVLPFLASAFVGALAGSLWGAKLSTDSKLRMALAAVLFVAALKMFLPE
jgi:uncharacterized membrane protein YfcA